MRLVAAIAAVVSGTAPVLNAQVGILASPASRSVAVGGTRTLTPTIQVAAGSPAPTYQWYRDNRPIEGKTALSLVLTNVQPADSGAYTMAVMADGQTLFTQPAMVGIATALKVVGDAYEYQADILHPNGNRYDQILMTGTAASVTADPDQVTRTSFIDLNDDIVQVEFSGAGTLTIVLQSSSAPAIPAIYEQPAVAYMKGHPTFTITGANETTNVTIFTVGRMTAYDPSGAYDISKPPSATNDPALTGSTLFKAGESYDGVADVALLNIASTDGKFGGVRSADARFYAVAGNTGLLAPNVEFTGPVYIHDVNASDAATPLLVTGAVASGEI
ncbi:MAG: immunoglobulin domain-containing protein, partial [Opitutus sp.]